MAGVTITGEHDGPLLDPHRPDRVKLSPEKRPCRPPQCVAVAAGGTGIDRRAKAALGSFSSGRRHRDVERSVADYRLSRRRAGSTRAVDPRGGCGSASRLPRDFSIRPIDGSGWTAHVSQSSPLGWDQQSASRAGRGSARDRDSQSADAT